MTTKHNIIPLSWIQGCTRLSGEMRKLLAGEGRNLSTELARSDSKSSNLKKISAILMALTLLVVYAVLPVRATSRSYAGSVFTVNPDADTYVNSSNPDTNYGSSTQIRVDGLPIVRSYLRFNIQGLSDTVTKATLRVYANSFSSYGYDVHAVSDNTWDEASITYNNAPPLGNMLGSSGSFSGGVWTSVDVTTYVTGNGTYTLELDTPSSTAISLASRESGNNAPQLIIETQVGTGSTPTATQAPTQTTIVTSTNTPASSPTPTPALTQATSPTPQGNQFTFAPNADAYVNETKPNTNYGSSRSLRADGSPNVRSYLRFNVQGLNNQVIRATLRVFAESSSSYGYVVQNVNDNTWDEAGITYNNAPPVGALLGSSGSFDHMTWTSVDVTSYITGSGTYSLALSTPDHTAIRFSSREEGTETPQLIIETQGGTGATPTSTATPVPSPTSTTTIVPSPTPTSTLLPTPSNTPVPSAIQHVFVVVMENHSYDQVWNTSSSPYITSLGNSYARATNYHAITHPSLPNYLDLFGGDNYGITTDCSPSFSCHVNAVNLADNLEAKGLSWKGYMQSMPSPCYLSSSGDYAPRHNPFVYFDDIRNDSTRCDSHDVPYSDLASDLASTITTPNYAMITPNLCNDMHDCSVSTGDTWLQNNLPTILNSPACTIDTCLLILTWDEDNGSQNNQVLTIFAGSAARTGGVISSSSYTHFSLLRTVEDIFGLPTQTNNDASAQPMNDLLR